MKENLEFAFVTYHVSIIIHIFSSFDIIISYIYKNQIYIKKSLIK